MKPLSPTFAPRSRVATRVVAGRCVKCGKRARERTIGNMRTMLCDRHYEDAMGNAALRLINAAINYFTE